MGLLHRHIFASVAGATAIAVGFFAFLLVTGEVLRRLLDFFTAGLIGPATVFRLVVLTVPYAAVYALPIGLLTAVLLVLGRMSSQQEITAMRAAGLSLGYIARPIWLIAGSGVVVLLALNFHYMPLSRTQGQVVLTEAMQQNPLKIIEPKTFVRDPKGRFVLYVGGRDGPRLEDFWCWRLDKQKRVLSVIRAKAGTAGYREEDGHVVLALNDVSVETRDRKAPESFSKPPLIATFESTSLELPPEMFGSDPKQAERKKKSKWMTFAELSSRRAELEAKGSTVTKDERAELTNLTVTLHSKAAASFAVLAFALVAVPLGIKVSRKETSANLGIAVALVLGYYFLAALAGTLERSPALRPELWVWAPPLIYTAVGVWLFRRVDRA